MNLKQMRQQLIRAEMDLACFNARRTAAVEEHPGIQRGSTPEFESLVDPTRPASTYYNRAAGKSAESLSAGSLRSLAKEIVSVEVAPDLLTKEAAGELLALGFAPSHQLCYLGCVPSGALPLDRDVVRFKSWQTDDFFDLLQLSGVDFPPERRASKRSFYCTEQFQVYVAKAPDGTACGWATAYLNGTSAFLGNSFTLPKYRKLGAHGALLTARLNAAAELGIEAVYTDVEHGSQSHHNCERAGLRILTINTIWGRSRQEP